MHSQAGQVRAKANAPEPPGGLARGRMRGGLQEVLPGQRRGLTRERLGTM